MSAINRPTVLELEITEILTSERGQKYTDLHLSTSGVVRGRIGANRWEKVTSADGTPVHVSAQALTAFLEAIFRSQDDPLAHGALVQGWKTRLQHERSLHPSMYISSVDAAGVETLQRVRITVQRQSTGSDIGLMVRALRPLPESIETLGLPVVVVNKFISNGSGLILVVGPTGAGKTTTIASILNEINATREGHIVTIEDPIEYVFEPAKCIVNQREIGIDVATFHDGVKDALRFVPDVIMIGEIRDAETMLSAVRAAESGHLVIASMHAPSTVHAVRKALGYLNSAAEELSFANSLIGILAQQLTIGQNGDKHLAYETLNGRAENVRRAIATVMADRTGKSLDELEMKLRNGDLRQDFCIQMRASVEELIAKKAITAEVGAAALYTADDVRAVLRPNQSI